MAMSENFKGAALMSGSMAGFVANDAFIKLVGPDIGLFQTIFVRGLFTVALLGVLAWLTGAFRYLPGRADLRLISMRTVAEIGATLAFLTALFHMPLANVTAILQVLPLTIALAAAIFLGEPIGRRRIGAILAGFLGVMIIVRPGAADFNIYAILGLVAVACVTLRDLSVRRFSPQVSSMLVAFITAVVVTVMGGVGTLVQGEWTPLGSRELIFLIFAAVFIFMGYYCSVAAMRVGEVAVVATYRYSVLLWAVLLGWWVFGDLPDFWTILGMLLIAAAGLFTMWRESRTARSLARPAGPPTDG